MAQLLNLRTKQALKFRREPSNRRRIFVILFFFFLIVYLARYIELFSSIHGRFIFSKTVPSFSDLRIELLGQPLSECAGGISLEMHTFYQAYARHHATQLKKLTSGQSKSGKRVR